VSFYKSISEYYREIFPYNPAQAGFVMESFPDPSGLELLDVGCGTGDLATELSGSFGGVYGIDLDQAMIKAASKSAVENVDFFQLNMLDIQKHFGDARFNTVLCLGNTLVHLDGLSQIADFLNQAGKVLSGDGKLLLQIINYDRILDMDIRALPTIETEHCRFQRSYHYIEELHRIEFETILTIETKGINIRNKIPLYPLRRSELEKILCESGFTSVSYYGNFRREPLEAESIPMVIEAG